MKYCSQETYRKGSDFFLEENRKCNSLCQETQKTGHCEVVAVLGVICVCEWNTRQSSSTLIICWKLCIIIFSWKSLIKNQWSNREKKNQCAFFCNCFRFDISGPWSIFQHCRSHLSPNSNINEQNKVPEKNPLYFFLVSAKIFY